MGEASESRQTMKRKKASERRREQILVDLVRREERPNMATVISVLFRELPRFSGDDGSSSSLLGILQGRDERSTRLVNTEVSLADLRLVRSCLFIIAKRPMGDPRGLKERRLRPGTERKKARNGRSVRKIKQDQRRLSRTRSPC